MFTFQSGRGFSGLSMFRTKCAHLRSHDANLFILHFIIVYYYFAVATDIIASDDAINLGLESCLFAACTYIHTVR